MIHCYWYGLWNSLSFIAPYFQVYTFICTCHSGDNFTWLQSHSIPPDTHWSNQQAFELQFIHGSSGKQSNWYYGRIMPLSDGKIPPWTIKTKKSRQTARNASWQILIGKSSRNWIETNRIELIRCVDFPPNAQGGSLLMFALLTLCHRRGVHFA